MNDEAEPLVLETRDEHGDRGYVAHVKLNRPSRSNALDTATLKALQLAISSNASNESLRALVLSGAGGHAFIAGADIGELATLDASSAETFITRIHRVCEALRTCPVPVIAKIEGHCYGAGLEIAAACDMRVATEYSHFGMPEVRVGVPSVIEAALLPHLIGWGKTRELLLTGETIGAQEALDCGLIEKCCTIDEINLQVMRWVRAILESGPEAVRAQKALIGEWENTSIREGIERGISAFRKAYEGDEPRRFTQAFLDRKAQQKK